MKKIILTISLILILSSIINAQYSVIFDAGNHKAIYSMTSFSNVYNNNISFYLSLTGDSLTAASPSWSRYYRNSNSWVNNVHSPFLTGGTCFYLGQFYWSVLESFIRSPIDTNFLFGRYHWITCMYPEDGYTTKLSYNNGQSVTSPSFGVWCFDIDPQNDSILYGIGAPYLTYPNLWISTNKGNNWSQNNIPYNNPHTYDLIKVKPLKHNEIYIINDSSVYRSTNFGSSFSLRSIIHSYITSFNFDYTDSSFYLTSNHYVSSLSGIYKSTNSGLNWYQVKSNVRSYSILINPDNHTKMYCATDSGLFCSSNTGQTWVRYFDFFSPSLKVLGMAKYRNDGDTIYAANNKRVYKIWAPLVGISTSNMEAPTTFSLSQNYPNPFNPTTKIKFEIPLANGIREGQGVKLSIYDILGREVATLVNEELKPGTYEVEWDASTNPSGVYFYKLTTKPCTNTKRMVLIK